MVASEEWKVCMDFMNPVSLNDAMYKTGKNKNF